MKDDNVYLQHIKDAINKIEQYLEGYSYEQFLEDSKTVDAVIREVSIIGEASNNISKEFQMKHSELPWRRMVGMRNRLIHEYFGVSEESVWSTAKDDLPPLKKQIEEILM
ncbi:MAG: DUF86 domain-containing protein [Candidatus Parcubacteria bacterium]|nr:DUF86 domain-containing protein [Candidatus Parcubacteria bacterium]